MRFDEWFNDIIKKPDYLGKDLSKEAWNHQGKIIAYLNIENMNLSMSEEAAQQYALKMKNENKKLKDCVEYIHRRGYTGASFVASECLKEIENEERN